MATTSLSRRARMTGLLVSLAVLGIAVALTGNAGADPVSGGTTILRLNAPKGNGSIKPSAPATEQHKNIVLPNTGGDIDPVTGSGTVATSGGFRLRRKPGGTARAQRVRVTDIVMTFGPDGKVTATVDSATVDEKTVDLATLTGGTVLHPPDGSVIIKGAAMRMTKAGARAFKKLAEASGEYGENDKLGKVNPAMIFTTP